MRTISKEARHKIVFETELLSLANVTVDQQNRYSTIITCEAPLLSVACGRIILIAEKIGALNFPTGRDFSDIYIVTGYKDV